jgi:hypothetical protein
MSSEESHPCEQKPTPYRERLRMPVSKGPSWDTPARLNGLPAKNWKTREGATLSNLEQPLRSGGGKL